VRTTDRLILGALATGTWVLAFVVMTSQPIAYADPDPDFELKVNAYNVNGLNSFITRTVERCGVVEGAKISCE
jgi:hypothetical protein